VPVPVPVPEKPSGSFLRRKALLRAQLGAARAGERPRHKLWPTKPGTVHDVLRTVGHVYGHGHVHGF